MCKALPFRRSHAAFRGQRGVALLVLMLVLVVGSSYMLVSRMNEYAQAYARESRTQEALGEAKRALLSYAMNYPDLRGNEAKGPGFLPCPDQDDDGNPENCGNSVSATVRFGRLPFRILGFDDLRDSSGSRFWYGVSENFKNTLTDNTVINSETPGMLSVDGANDVVAVILAPGEPVASQTARPSNDGADYLEDDNATDGDGSFVSAGGDDFNDQVVVITRQELMEIVEKRVAGEVRAILAQYQANNGGAYPWLTPFADPKSTFIGPRGSHDGVDGSSNLTDNSRDFYEWRVQAGDLVRNITDGSIATVTVTPTPATDTLTLGTLSMGSENDFDNGDAYVVYASAIGSKLKGTAKAGSSGLTVVDTDRDFSELGVVPGDVIDKFDGSNLANRSSGVVDTVSANQITVTDLEGAATNSFAVNDEYVIRGNYGQSTGANDSTSLVDDYKNFVTMGIRAGDLVVNITDGSVARVASVTSATTLALDRIHLGAENDFDTGDYYYIPRYNTDNGTRKGLLSIHERGEHFKTGFDIDWSLLDTVGATILPSPGAQTDYITKLKSDIESSTATVSVSSDDGACVWMTEEFIECNGDIEYDDMTTGGIVTSGADTSTVTDTTQSFVADGVKRGDLIQNFNDEADLFTRTADAGSSGTTLYDVGANFLSYDTTGPFELLVRNNATGVQGVVTEIIDNNTLVAEDYPGGSAITFTGGQSYTLRQPQYMAVNTVSSATVLTTSQLTGTAPDFDVGEYYRVISAANSISDSNDFGSGAWMRDMTYDFGNEGVEVGDVVENVTDGSFGIINTVSGNWINAALYGGVLNAFITGNQYRIYHGYVSSRTTEFTVRFNGSEAEGYAVSGVRKRRACIGYTTNCVATAGAASVPYNSGIPVITITDFEDDADTAATTTSVIFAGSPTGNIRISNIDYYLAEDNDELPEWFVKNKWHQLLYVAVADAYAPGTTATDCIAGSDCLSVAVQFPSGTTHNDRQALVISAGSELSAQASSRVNGALDAWFEDDNAVDSDDLFIRDSVTTSFNDVISVVAP